MANFDEFHEIGYNSQFWPKIYVFRLILMGKPAGSWVWVPVDMGVGWL